MLAAPGNARLRISAALAVAAVGCGESGSGPVTPPSPPPPPPAAVGATYRIVFEATWSAATHPANFPGGAHFSPLIGAVHNAEATFWARDGIASPGIEVMAETGGTSTLAAEIRAQSPANVFAVINGSGTASPGGAAIAAVNVREDFPLVTLVTMIAPSPDWFAGVSGLSLQDEDGSWAGELEVVLYPYDAGTDDGERYTSANADTSPKEPIRSLRGTHPFSDEPVGRFIFTRTDG